MIARGIPQNIFIVLLLLSACSGKEKKHVPVADTNPKIEDNGAKIIFATDQIASFFVTEKIGQTNMTTEITAPAKVSAIVIPSDEGASQNLILFENPDLASTYTQLIQHEINIRQVQEINIKQRQVELGRIKDLQEHGAASGRDLLEAQTALSMEQTNLANERAALIEHETKLKAGGFDPRALRQAKAGAAFVICDIPENQISKITNGSECQLQFTSFPNEKFAGKIDAVADAVDNLTRMVKLRIRLQNPGHQFKAGMFAQVSFGVKEGENISVNKTSLITVQGNTYVFVKSNGREFERRTITTGMQIGDRIIVFSGLKAGEEIASQGLMQLKGLSFGY